MCNITNDKTSCRSAQIIAMGGGGFLMEPDNLSLDQYILDASRAATPKVCFVGTASGDAQSFIDRFYAAFTTLHCSPAHISLFKPEPGDLREKVLKQDVIYVGGGNTRNLLALWREWGFDSILREAWESGVVLAGISAGSICWFQQGLSDSVRPGELHPLTCLGFLPGSNCPHYDGEPDRRSTYQMFVAEGKMEAGYAADDGAALHFIGTKPARAVCSRPAAKVYRVERQVEGAVETPMEMELLSPA
jgi:peptidase E